MLVEKVRLVSKDEVSLTESRPRLRGRCPERAEGVQKAGKKIYKKTPIGPADHFPLLGGSNVYAVVLLLPFLLLAISGGK